MNYKKLFPFFENNEEIAYLDSAATTQKPKVVLDEVYNSCVMYNANPNRGSYSIAYKASQVMEEAKEKFSKLVGGNGKASVVFTKSCTESLNIVAYSYGKNVIKENDEVIVCVSSHHANLIPWQQITSEKKAKLIYVYLDENGQLDIDDLKEKLSPKTRLVTFSHGVNSTGIVNDAKKISKIVKEKTDAKVVLDCAQTVSHMKLELKEWDVDFATFSVHKMFGPMGLGILYVKEELISEMSPFVYGGGMIDFVEEQSSTFKEDSEKFDGGTPNLEGISGLNRAIDFINEIGIDEIHRYEDELLNYAKEKMKDLDFVELYYPQGNKISVLSFNVKEVHPHDVSQILDMNGVAIRTGHHCTQPLMSYLEIPSCCRMSISIYNTKEDIDKLVETLQKVKEFFLS